MLQIERSSRIEYCSLVCSRNSGAPCLAFVCITRRLWFWRRLFPRKEGYVAQFGRVPPNGLQKPNCRWCRQGDSIPVGSVAVRSQRVNVNDLEDKVTLKCTVPCAQETLNLSSHVEEIEDAYFDLSKLVLHVREAELLELPLFTRSLDLLEDVLADGWDTKLADTCIWKQMISMVYSSFGKQRFPYPHTFLHFYSYI